MIIEGPEALRSWLTSAMEPICDADPAALAKYVMALLKKDKSEQELKEFCVDQLDVFLQKETKGFVERLFNVVGDKSYLTTHGAKTASKAEAPASEPLRPSQPSTAGPSSTSSKSVESKTDDAMVLSTDDEGMKPRSDGRRRRISPPVREDRPARERNHREREHRGRSRSRSRSRDRREASRRGGGAALSRPRAVDRRERDRPDGRERRRSRSPRSRSRSPHDRHDRKDGASKDSKNKEGVVSDPNDSPARKSKKTRCRDYDEKGYCMRGDLCPFDHGPDPVVVDDSALEKMVNIGGSGASSKRMVAAMPNFSVPPPGYTPLNPPPPGVDSVYVPSASVAVASEAYNPEAPALSESSVRPPGVAVPPPGFTVPPPPLPSVIGSRPFFPTPYSVIGASVVVQPEHSLSEGEPSYKRGRGGIGIVGRLGPPPRGGAVNRYPGAADPNNKTLEVRKIPPQLNTITKLNEHFAQFGQITNIQVRYNADPEAALITFATRHQAMSAYKSTAPILNNRFIKVFWHGGGQNGDGTSLQGAAPSDTNLASLKDRLGAPLKRPLESADNEKTVYNTQKGSLTKTLYNPEAFKAGQHKYISPQQQQLQQLQIQQQQQQQQQLPPKKEANGSSAPAAPPVTRESYIEVRKRRKIDKQKKSAFLDLHRKKTELLSKQLEQQKLLIGQLGKTTDAARKKQIYKIFMSVDESVKRLKAEVEDVAKKLTALNSASQAAEAGVNVYRMRPTASRSKADVEKETLDVELELMTQQQAGADTTGLKQRLDDLKSELIATSEHNTELDQPLTSTPTQSAAGAPPVERKTSTSVKKSRMAIPHSASLDKRPRVLAVTGFASDQRDAVIEHLQQFGDLQDLEFDTRNDEPRAIVTFKTRKDAEQALALAGDFALCPLNVQWGTQMATAAEKRHRVDSSELVVPDEERKPEEQVTPAALLASIGDTESDESDKDDLLDDFDEQEVDDSAFDQV
uniref:RNA-binding protein 26 n=1 Tax=Plectus sambesii TaxID=2011161 RepID=A0A914W8T4_9BILA